MKVSRIKELLSAYADDDELMISWNDKDAFEFVLDRPLPLEIWTRAVERFDRSDMQEFAEDCLYQVIFVKDQLEKESKR